MARKIVGFTVSTLVIVTLLAPFTAMAQQKKAGSYPDIGIMNSIIKELMQVPYGTHDRIEVYGSYLPSFGLLFVVSPPYKFNFGWDFAPFDSTMAEFSKTMAQFDSSMEHFNAMAPRHKISAPRVIPFKEPPRPPVRRIGEEANNYSAGQYDAVMKFLESYADAENRLSPTQDIGVVVLSDGESPARFFRVSKKVVTDYRTGAGNEARFKENVRISTVQKKGKDNSIDIMATILDKSYGGIAPGEGFPFLSSSAQGVYLKGLGALFVCRPATTYSTGKFGVQSKAQHMDIAQLRDRTVQVLGNYGASLRFMPDSEPIMVLLNIDSFGSQNERLLISLKKRDIDLYTRNEIDLSALQQRATVIENQ